MAYSFLYAHIYFTTILLLPLLVSSSSPPFATTCVVIEDFPDGHFNVYSNECRGKSPYCLFSCIQHPQHRPPSPLSSAAAASSCFLIRFFDSGRSNVRRFNCSNLDYCSLSCLGPGDRSWTDLAIDLPDREAFDWDLGGGGEGEAESPETTKCEGKSIPAMAEYDEM